MVIFSTFGMVVWVASVRAQGTPLASARNRLRPVDDEGVDVAEIQNCLINLSYLSIHISIGQPHSQILERGLEVRPDVLGPVVAIPQLGLKR